MINCTYSPYPYSDSASHLLYNEHDRNLDRITRYHSGMKDFNLKLIHYEEITKGNLISVISLDNFFI